MEQVSFSKDRNALTKMGFANAIAKNVNQEVYCVVHEDGRGAITTDIENTQKPQIRLKKANWKIVERFAQ